MAVVALAFALLMIRAVRVGLAAGYLDPIAHISSQDEALYSHSAIQMAERGDWLTPHFLGRLALYKPPLTDWLAAASARAFGVSRVTLRFPIVFLTAFALGLLFFFAAGMGRWESGAFAVLFLLSNRLWMVPASMVLTDALLASFEIAAMYCLLYDPWLESPAAFWGFAGAFAAAVMTKGVAAGPLALAFLLYCVFAPPRYRPTWRRALLAPAAAAALVLPWYFYQTAVHTRWFLAEHIGLEIFSFGAGAPPQTTRESQLGFYLQRFVVMDPLLFAFAMTAIPAWFTALRKRSAEATLLACWLAPMLAAIFLWQYRNATYVIPCLAPLAVAAAVYAPLSSKAPGWTALILALAFAAKLATPAQPWGLSFAPETLPAAPALENYCRQQRGNDLMVVDLVDDLYASTLPLANLRYGLISPSLYGGQLTMDFPAMGITMSAADFDRFDAIEPHYREVLRQWGIDSSEPLARLIVASTPAALMALARSHPLTDFFLPQRYRLAADEAAGAGHQVEDAGPGFFWLKSRQPLPRAAPPAWSCEL